MNNIAQVSDNNFKHLSSQIENIFYQRQKLTQELHSNIRKLTLLTLLYFVKDKRDAQKSRVDNLKIRLDSFNVNISFTNIDKIKSDWQKFYELFTTTFKNGMSWDIVYSQDINPVDSRTVAKVAYNRKEIIYKEKNLSWILCGLKCLYLPNKRGNDIFLYPTFFVVLEKNGKKVQVYGTKDLRITR